MTGRGGVLRRMWLVALMLCLGCPAVGGEGGNNAMEDVLTNTDTHDANQGLRSKRFAGSAEFASTWMHWSEWSACPTTCGRSHSTRVRACRGQGHCEGEARQTKVVQCGQDGVSGMWSEWDTRDCMQCAHPQNHLGKVQRRACVSSFDNVCGAHCEGQDTIPCEYNDCYRTHCATRQQTSWTQWSEWDVTCGLYAIRYRDMPCEFVGGIPKGMVDCGTDSEENCMGGDYDEQERRGLPPCPGQQ